MSVVDLEIGTGLPLVRNEVYLRASRMHTQATAEHKGIVDSLSLEENAKYLDSLRALKKAVDHAQIWRDENIELILAQYN